jgi:hypothetical protein
MMERANNMVAQANARAQKAEDRARILARQLEEAQRQMMSSDGPSSTIDAPMLLEGGSRKGKEREEAYDGGDEDEEEEV